MSAAPAGGEDEPPFRTGPCERMDSQRGGVDTGETGGGGMVPRVGNCAPDTAVAWTDCLDVAAAILFRCTSFIPSGDAPLSYVVCARAGGIRSADGAAWDESWVGAGIVGASGSIAAGRAPRDEPGLRLAWSPADLLIAAQCCTPSTQSQGHTRRRGKSRARRGLRASAEISKARESAVGKRMAGGNQFLWVFPCAQSQGQLGGGGVRALVAERAGTESGRTPNGARRR